MAFIIVVLFLLFAVAFRVALQYKITGDHGVRLVKRGATKGAIFSSLLLLISCISIFIFTLLEAIGVLQSSSEPHALIIIFGVIVAIAGMVLTVISQYQMGAAWRIGVDEAEKTDLITTGVYSCIRNPIYSGVMLSGLGLLLISPNIYIVLSLVLGYLSIEIHVRYIEEPHLLRLHGQKFEHYMSTAGRYLPTKRS